MTKAQAKLRGTTLKKLLSEIETKNDRLPDYDRIAVETTTIKFGIFEELRPVIAITSPGDTHSTFTIFIPCNLDHIETRILQGLSRLVKSWKYAA